MRDLRKLVLDLFGKLIGFGSTNQLLSWLPVVSSQYMLLSIKVFKYVVRLSRNGIGFDYEVMARTSYEAKITAERFYPDHTAVRANRA